MRDDEDLPPRPDFLPPGFGTVGRQDFVEIAVSPPVPYTPQTVGWYVLGGLVLVATGIAAWRFARRYRNNAYRRAALRELVDLRSHAQSDRAGALGKLPALLKRCAIAGFSRLQVAGLSGDAWFAFLERSAPGALSKSSQEALQTLVLRSPTAVSPQHDDALFGEVATWIRRHRA